MTPMMKTPPSASFCFCSLLSFMVLLGNGACLPRWRGGFWRGFREEVDSDVEVRGGSSRAAHCYFLRSVLQVPETRVDVHVGTAEAFDQANAEVFGHAA